MQVLFIHEKLLNITGASVNQERTLLGKHGFVIGKNSEGIELEQLNGHYRQ